MDKRVTALIIVLVGTSLVFGGWWLATSDDSTTDTATQTQVTQQEADGITEPEIVTFTSAEVADHDTNTDCFTIIGGSVYDITAFLPAHPGGTAILRACGNDGTTLFTERTTTDGEVVGSGTSHSKSAYSQLGQYFVGNLED